jgi:hypothetical protein
MFFALIVNVRAQTPLKPKDKTAILQVLEGQRQSWNQGDIEQYMQGYWKSDSLKFIGKSGLTYGWENTLKNYKKGYPDKEAMGQLVFEIISTELVGKDAAFITGKWTLNRSKGNIGGHFSLLFKKIKGKWLIVADHSS